MKRIRYDGEELIVVDEVADALMSYAVALAKAGSADCVQVPTLTTTGGTQTVDLFLNGSIHLTARPIQEPPDQRHPASNFVAELDLRAGFINEV